MTDRVLLTGISGWIAKHIAIELLNSGYEVLGTVRNQSSLEKTKKTLSEYVSIDKLSFVELDLLKDEGWNEAPRPRSRSGQSTNVCTMVQLEHHFGFASKTAIRP